MTKRTMGGLLAAGMAILLAGCLLLPGKFASDLALHRDGTFAFSYRGEIYVAPLVEPDAAAPAAQFSPEPCYDEETIEEKTCSADDLAKQKADWEEAQQAKIAEKKKDAEMTKAMLGGIDPNDPRAAEEFAQRLMRQEGWKSVVSRGSGRFEVEFATSGRLDHDFTFPTIEKMPGVSPFVTVIRRSDGTVRIEAPAFSPTGAATPMAAILQGMGMPGKSEAGSEADKMPKAEGLFAVVTDGEILANNTDEGPKADPAGKRLEWQVNAQTPATPSALVRVR